MLSVNDRAITLNDLANSYALEMRYTKAIARYKEALALYLSLSKEEPLKYGLHIAHVFSNLSIIYLQLKKIKESHSFYCYGLKMHRVLAKHNIQIYGIGFASAIIEGVYYLKQSSLNLYEAEIVLKKFRGVERAENLLQGIMELRKR